MKTFITLHAAVDYVTGRGWGVQWVGTTGYVYNVRGYVGELVQKNGDWAFIRSDI